MNRIQKFVKYSRIPFCRREIKASASIDILLLDKKAKLYQHTATKRKLHNIMNDLCLQDRSGSLSLQSLCHHTHWRRVQAIGATSRVAMMMASITYPWLEEDVKAWIRDGEFQNRLGYRLGIFHNLCGLVGVVGINGPTPSLSVFAAPSIAREGVASNACRLAMYDAVRRFDLDHFSCDVFADNASSQSFVRRLGFQKTSELPGRSMARSAGHLVYRYSMS